MLQSTCSCPSGNRFAFTSHSKTSLPFSTFFPGPPSMKLSIRGLWICLWPLLLVPCGGATDIDRVNCVSLACKGDIPKMCVYSSLMCVDVRVHACAVLLLYVRASYCACVNTCVCVYVCACVYVCMCMCVCVCVCVFLNVCVCVCVCMCVCV
jgi:hypothetical protein